MIIGLIFSAEPNRACALPIRPPFRRYSRVSKRHRHWARLAAVRAVEMTSDWLAPLHRRLRCSQYDQPQAH